MLPNLYLIIYLYYIYKERGIIMADETYRTPEEQLSFFSDLLLQSIIKTDSISKQNRSYIFGSLPPLVFRDVNFVIYSLLYNFKDKGIVPDSAFIQLWLMRNTKFLQENRGRLDIKAYSDLDEDEFVAYTVAVIKQYRRLQGLEVLSNEEFLLTIEKYKNEYSAYEINRAYSEAKIILYDGLYVGSRFYQGFQDSTAYVKKISAEVEAVLDHTKGIGFIDSSVAGIVDDESSVTPEKIGDFGYIHELNKHLGGIFTSIFYSIMAPTKGGKSKFCARLIHTIVVKYGVNVSVWAHEGGHKAWWAQLRAIHFDYLYIDGKPETERVAPLSQQQILFGNYPTDELRQLEVASRLDLFSNPDYGNISMIDRPFKVETFIEDIETSVQLNGSKAVLIDYLQLIGWDTSGLTKTQAVGRAYQLFLSYCNKRNIAGISPSQFTQSFMDEMASSKDGQMHEVRTAGGESSETTRTPDINIALYATIEDIMHRQMTIMSAPSRLASPYPDIQIYADLCSCVFSSLQPES